MHVPRFTFAIPSGPREEAAAPPDRTLLRLPPPLGDCTLEAHRSLASVESDWRAFEQRAAGHPYQSFHWLSAWDAHLRAGDVQPFVVVLRDGAGIRMLLPLAIERRLGMRSVRPMGDPVCDYHAPLVDADFAVSLTPDLVDRLLRAIVALAQADYGLLTRVPPLAGAVRNPFSAIAVRPFTANAHGAILDSDWETFYTARRSAATRSRLRGKENALARSGAIAFNEITEPRERVRLVNEMLALKAARLSVTAGAFTTLARADVRQFFLTLARDAAPGNVRLFQLTAGGTLVAAVLGIVHQGRFYYEVPVFAQHPAQRFSPGHLLLTRLMEWAIAQGCTRFDFTIGDEPYKSDWCDETWTLGCGAWARTHRGRIGVAIALSQLAMVRRVKSHRALYALAMKLRTALGRIWQALRSAHA